MFVNVSLMPESRQGIVCDGPDFSCNVIDPH